MVVLTMHSSWGILGSCDARCYNAQSKSCLCICGGKNHGVGRKQAIVNARQIVKELEANVTPSSERNCYIIKCSPQPWLF